jgi:hypothetical protein
LVLAVLYALLGLIFAGLWLPFSQVMGRMPGVSGGAGMIMGAMALVMFPVIYGAMAFIGGVVTALLYNLVAGWTGGVEITLESRSVSGEPLGSAVV